MSLINDALKRASQGQKPPAQGGAPERPVPPSPPEARRYPKLLITLILLVISLLGLSSWLFVKWSQRPVVTAAAPALPAPVSASIQPPLPIRPPTLHVVERAATPAAVTTPPARPAFPQLKLKTILARQSKPSAVINNKTVSVGDLIDGVKVMAIAPGKVTVNWNGQSKDLVIMK